MASKTLTEDQVVVNRGGSAQVRASDRAQSSAKGVDGGSDADNSDDADGSDRGSDGETDADSSDRNVSDHSADSDSGPHDRSESGSTTTTPNVSDSSDRGPSQPR